MKKLLLLAVLIVSAATTCLAQKNQSFTTGKFSIGIDPGIPVGSSSDVSNFVLGADIKYSLPAAQNFDISLSAGYSVFLGKTVTIGGTQITYSDLKAFPVKLAGRYNFNGPVGFFGEFGVGAAFITDGGGTAFVYAPGVGYALNGGFEIGARYEGWSKNGTVGQIGFRLAYTFR
jgi:hypothetical protein